MVSMVNYSPLRWAERGPFTAFALSLSAAIIVLDQITKWMILSLAKLSPEGCLEFGMNCRKIEISAIFDLTMVWNRGISFGLLDGFGLASRIGLSLFALVICAVLVHWLWKIERRFSAVAIGMIIGGAIGNVIDRIRFGAVVDFFDFSGLWFPYVFNIADAAISLGVGLFFLDLILDERSNKSAQ
jgi:signal peptidase II